MVTVLVYRILLVSSKEGLALIHQPFLALTYKYGNDI